MDEAFENEQNDWLERTMDEETVDVEMSEIESVPYIVIIHGENRGKRIRVDADQVTLGRTDASDIILEDRRVSRVHCQVLFSDGNIIVKDCESRNGTFVDGHKIDKGEIITSHSQVSIGRTVFKVSYKAIAEAELEEEIFEAATTDSLTAIHNRRWFFEQVHPAIAYAIRHNSVIAFILLDIDHFKLVNDQYGHQAGDEVLRGIAGILDSVKRDEDLLCRYGGEEFLLMVRGDNKDDAPVVSERFRSEIEKRKFDVSGEELLVTASFGISYFREGDNINTAVMRADNALYKAKENGRNQIQIAE